MNIGKAAPLRTHKRREDDPPVEPVGTEKEAGFDTVADDLEVDDGVSDAPLVRLVNSIIFQAAEDGASDIHFEPQEDCARRALPDRRRAPGGAAHPEAHGERRHDAPQGAGEARHRRAPQAAGRPHLAERAAAGRTLDIRVATLPTVDGESVVMRLLDKSKHADARRARLSDEAMRAR
jgi:type II secretory ATPase GspE/PulE/Tfp pilus assembly ATPase PilB-like protein